MWRRLSTRESEGSGRDTNEEKERREGGQQGVWQLPEDVTWDVLLPRVSGVNH